jgi:hypothetical protein
VLARQAGATIRVVDVSVDADPSYLDGIDPESRPGAGAAAAPCETPWARRGDAAFDLGRAGREEIERAPTY